MPEEQKIELTDAQFLDLEFCRKRVSALTERVKQLLKNNRMFVETSDEMVLEKLRGTFTNIGYMVMIELTKFIPPKTDMVRPTFAELDEYLTACEDFLKASEK